MPRTRIVMPPAVIPEAPLELGAPPSKSIALRALVLAASAGGGTVRDLSSLPRDVASLVAGLEALGYPLEKLPDGFRILGPLPAAPTQAVRIQVGDGAAPARFLLALAARQARPVIVDGSERLRERPMEPLILALRSLGVGVTGGPGLPVTITGPIQNGGNLTVSGDHSSQYLSALLLALPGCGHDVSLRSAGALVSAPYVDLTREVLKQFGVPIPGALHIPAGSGPSVADIRVETDWSAGVALLAAAPFLGCAVRVPGLTLRSLQPDRGLMEIMRSMGLSFMEVGGAIEAWGSIQHGGEFDLGHLPDAAPTLAALATLTDAQVCITGVPHLRLKESDRIAALVEILRRVGAHAEARPDGLVVRGGDLQVPAEAAPVSLETRGDHRMAMAGALLGLRRPVLIDDVDCTAKSFPGFFDQWPGARSGPSAQGV